MGISALIQLWVILPCLSIKICWVKVLNPKTQFRDTRDGMGRIGLITLVGLVRLRNLGTNTKIWNDSHDIPNPTLAAHPKKKREGTK